MTISHRRLGRTAVRVSNLCLGTMNFGPRTTESEAFEIMDAALDAGINFFDTADQYGGDQGVGTTETIIGNWLAARPGARDRIVLATKAHEPMSDDPNDRGLSAYHLRRACEASLRRLRTDHIDLYQFHHIDRAASWDEVWQAAETLVAQSKVSYIGSSNFAGWHIAQANETARARNFLGLVSEQGLYNLTERTAELEVIPACEAYGMALIPWSPLAGGALADPNDAGVRRADAADRVAADPRFAAWLELCRELGESPAIVALSWLLHQPAVTAPIIGPRTLDQLTSALRAPALELDTEVLGRLDELFPGPGAAPEAYAW